MYVVLTPVFGLALFRIRPDLAVWLGVALAVIGLALLSGVSAGSVTGTCWSSRRRLCTRSRSP